MQNINVLIQVNLSQEKSKYGVQQLDELFQLAETLHAEQWIKLRGLMTIPTPDLGETSTRKLFEKLRMWRDYLQKELCAPEINELSGHDCGFSMGNSGRCNYDTAGNCYFRSEVKCFGLKFFFS